MEDEREEENTPANPRDKENSSLTQAAPKLTATVGDRDKQRRLRRERKQVE